MHCRWHLLDDYQSLSKQQQGPCQGAGACASPVCRLHENSPCSCQSCNYTVLLIKNRSQLPKPRSYACAVLTLCHALALLTTCQAVPDAALPGQPALLFHTGAGALGPLQRNLQLWWQDKERHLRVAGGLHRHIQQLHHIS